MRSFLESIDQLRAVAIYGTGPAALQAKDLLQAHESNIVCFINDQQDQQVELEGFKVFSLEAFLQLAISQVIITGFDVDEKFQRLFELGIHDCYVMPTDVPNRYHRPLPTTKNRLLFITKANEHCRVYFQNLRGLLAQHDFELEHFTYQDRLLSDPFYKLYFDERTLGIISLNNYAFVNQTFLRSLRTLRAQRDLPHIIYMIDHPIYLLDMIELDENTHFVYLNKSHIDFMNRFLNINGSQTHISNAYVLPEAITQDWSVEQYQNKEFPVVLPVTFNWRNKTLTGCESRINRFAGELRKVIWECIEAFYSNEEYDLLKNADFLISRSESIALSDQQTLAVLRLIDHYIILKKRLALLKTAKDYPILIIGDGIPAELKNDARADFCSRVSMSEYSRITRNAQVVIDASQSSTPCHDRVVNAMASGGVAATIENDFIRTHFQIGKELLTYTNDQDSIKELFESILAHQKNMEEIAENGWKRFHAASFREKLYGNFASLVRLFQLSDF